jgi:ER membrane protein complex subunit 1
VYNLPKQLTDPRRPNMNNPPELREPGLPPYIPELLLPQEFVLNYNQSLWDPRGIETSPTGLESTSVVFVYGLDLYCTRIAPSKGFDLLKDDFDYYVISSVLAALIGAAFITKKLSQRKSLKQAWR